MPRWCAVLSETEVNTILRDSSEESLTDNVVKVTQNSVNKTFSVKSFEVTDTLAIIYS